MDTHPAMIWWIAAGALIALELATGTFYLLMLALGAVAAALAAHLGLAGLAQTMVGTIVGCSAVLILHRQRRTMRPLPAQANPDVNLDIGQTVQVSMWGDGGTTTVKYRGAEWQARLLGGAEARAGRFVIRAIDGCCLLLEAE